MPAGGHWRDRSRFDAERADALAAAGLLLRMICADCAVSVAEVHSDRRAPAIARVRTAFVWVARRSVMVARRDGSHIPAGFTVLSEVLQRNDHSTAMHHAKRGELLRAGSARFRRDTDRWLRLQRAGLVKGIVTGLSAAPVAPIKVEPFALSASACRKAKNDLCPDDGDALARARASGRFLEALRVAHPERCAA